MIASRTHFTTAGSVSDTVVPVSTETPDTLAMLVTSPGAAQRAGFESAGISPCVRVTVCPAARSPTAKSTMPSVASFTTTPVRSLVPVLVTTSLYSAPLPTVVVGAVSELFASKKVTPPSTLTSFTIWMSSRSQRTTAGSLSVTVAPVSTDCPLTVAMLVTSPGSWQRPNCSRAGISACVSTTLWPASRSPTGKSTMPSVASLITTFTRSLVPVLVTTRR